MGADEGAHHRTADEPGPITQTSAQAVPTEGTKLMGFPRVRVECDFLSPIYREDVVTVSLTPVEIGDKKLAWGFKAAVGERAVAQGVLTTVYAWREGQGPMSAALVPLDIKTALQQHFTA